jgi:CRP-like cAMP-binding protein
MRLLNLPKEIEALIEKHQLVEILSPILLDALELCEYEGDEVILEAQEQLSHYFFFIQGKLKVYQRQANGRNLLIQFYTKFDSLGDVELTQDLPVTCTVEAVEKSRLLRLDAALLRRHAMTHVPFLNFVIRSLSSKMRSADENHAFNLLNPVKNRLASYILWHKGNSLTIDFNDSLQDISEFIGTTYRQLHRAFLQLEEDRVISRNGKTIEVMNINALESLAGQIYHIL